MMNKIFNFTEPKLYDKQRAFVDCQSRYTVIEASTKSGKTVACMVWIFEQAMKGKAGQNFWWIAPIREMAGIPYRRMKMYLQTSGLPQSYWSYSEVKQSIKVPTNAIITFKGSENYDALYGEDVYAAVIDEASRCREEAWHALRTTLTATKGPIKIIGNVKGRKNWAYQLARRAEAGESGYSYFHITAYDAVKGGILDDQEVEDAKRALPEHVFKELYLNIPTEDGSNPFGIKAIQNCIKPISELSPIVFGCDLAKSTDYTVLCGLDMNKQVCYLDRWQSDWGQTRTRILAAIGDVMTLVDSTGVGDPIVEDLQRISPNVRGFHFSSTSKQQLMEGLSAAIQQGLITFPDGWIVNELDNFQYEYTRTGVRYAAMEGAHDDGVCALALANRLAAVPALNADLVMPRRIIGGEEVEERGWRTANV